MEKNRLFQCLFCVELDYTMGQCSHKSGDNGETSLLASVDSYVLGSSPAQLTQAHIVAGLYDPDRTHSDAPPYFMCLF